MLCMACKEFFFLFRKVQETGERLSRRTAWSGLTMEVSLTVMHKWDLGEELLQESQQEAMVAWLGKESLAESQGG